MAAADGTDADGARYSAERRPATPPTGELRRIAAATAQLDSIALNAGGKIEQESSGNQQCKTRDQQCDSANRAAKHTEGEARHAAAAGQPVGDDGLLNVPDRGADGGREEAGRCLPTLVGRAELLRTVRSPSTCR